MIEVRVAVQNDIAVLVELETGRFREDAGQHERFADVTWPEREGHDDFERLIASPSSIVLVGTNEGVIVGFAVGYLQQSSPTRLPVTYGVLRSLFVDLAHRNSGMGSRLTETFLGWARESGCAEALVQSYAANEGAQRFCAGHGFETVSVSRALPL